MSAITKPAMIALYRNLMKNAIKFTDYNFKAYAVRRIRTGFKENSNLNDKNLINEKYTWGLSQLASLKRQVIVSSLYPETESVMTSTMK